METINMGVPGFDKLSKKGVPKGSSILISGVPGVGKTLFALQFLNEGAKKGENCLLISCEQIPEVIVNAGELINPKFKDLLNKNVFILHKPITTKIVSFGDVFDMIQERNISRVVLDSLVVFEYLGLLNEDDYRKELLNFLEKVGKSDITFLATNEQSQAHVDEGTYSSQEYLFDTLIFLNMVRKGSTFERVIRIHKIRDLEHSLDIYPYVISKGGINIRADQMPFSLIEGKKGFK